MTLFQIAKECLRDKALLFLRSQEEKCYPETRARKCCSQQARAHRRDGSCLEVGVWSPYGSEHLGLLESSYAERGWAAVQERRRGKKPWWVADEGAQNVPSLCVAPSFPSHKVSNWKQLKAKAQLREDEEQLSKGLTWFAVRNTAISDIKLAMDLRQKGARGGEKSTVETQRLDLEPSVQ